MPYMLWKNILPISPERVKLLFLFFLQVVGCAWKLEFDYGIFVGFSQASLSELWNNKSAVGIWKKIVDQYVFSVLNDNSCLLLQFYENHVKKLVHKLQTKMLLVNQFAGFLIFNISKNIWGRNFIFCIYLDLHGSYSLIV